MAFSFPCYVAGQPNDRFGFSASPRKNNEWRVTIHDVDRMGHDICHVDTIHCDSTNPIDILHAALDAYREDRGPTPEPELTLFDGQP